MFLLLRLILILKILVYVFGSGARNSQNRRDNSVLKKKFNICRISYILKFPPSNIFTPYPHASFTKPAFRNTQPLDAFTICAWLRPVRFGCIFSYEYQRANEFSLCILRRQAAKKVLPISVHIFADYRVKTKVWQHICFSWSVNGSWIIYLNGEARGTGEGFLVGRKIQTGGTAILGQKHADVNGRFSKSLAYEGEMEGLQIWNHRLKQSEVFKLGKCQMQLEGNLLAWSQMELNLHDVQFQMSHVCPFQNKFN